MNDQHHLAGIRGAARRYGHPEPADLAGEIWLTRVQRELTTLVETVPALTDAQRSRLRKVLAAGEARALHRSPDLGE